MVDNKIIEGAGYIRVSTHMQDELSPDAQKRLLLEYAKNNNILLSEEHIYIESGISGKRADRRPEFQRMIAEAKKKPTPYNVILVWKFSRFARNQEESIVYKSLLRKECNIEVVSVSEPIIDGPFGSLIERIIEWMDEYYSIRLSGEVFRGMTEKAMRGGYLARPPLGYRIEHKGQPPVVVPEEAKIIRMIFDLYLNQNVSMYNIARKLNALGIKTRESKKFEKRSVEYIIQNPVYKGWIRWNKKENETQIMKDKEEWIVRKGFHEPIIPEDVFDKANDKYAKEYKPRGSRPSATYKHWLSGLLKCSNCGRTLVTSSRKDPRYGRTYVNFQCYGYHKGKCTISHQVSEKKIVPAVIASLKEVVNTHDVEYEIEQPMDESTDELGLLKLALDKNKQKETRIKDAFVNGIDTMEEYKQNKILIQNEKEGILAAISRIKEESKTKIDQKEEVIRCVKNVLEIIESEHYTNEEKNIALKSIIKEIVYNKPEDFIKVRYYIVSKPLK